MRNITLLTTVEPGRAQLLDFFLQRYLPWVDDCMVFFQKDGESTDTSALEEVCDRYRVDHTDTVGEFDCGATFGAMEEWARGHLAGGWLLPLDVDEFVEAGVNLRQLAAECEANGWLWVRGWMTDRHAPAGQIVPLDPTRPLERQFPLRSDITGSIAGGSQTKVVLARWPLIGKIHLYAAEGDPLNARVHPCTLTLNHYKWHSDVVGRLERRVEIQRRQGKPWAEEHAAMVAYLKENGRVDMPRYLISASEEIPGEPAPGDLYRMVAGDLPATAHLVEVGCGAGKGSALLAELGLAHGKSLRIDCIMGAAGPAPPGRQAAGIVEFSDNMKLARADDRVNLVQLPAAEVARAYRGGSLDFVSIAGAPGGEVLGACETWLPKLKPGGLICISARGWDASCPDFQRFLQGGEVEWLGAGAGGGWLGRRCGG